jgi:hypothetical protein
VVDKNYTAAFAPLIYPDTVFTAGADDIVHAVGHALKTGAGPFQLTTTLADLPLNLLTATDYYFIKIDADTGYWADSLAHALAGVHIDIGDAGTGVHSIVDTVNTKDPSQPFLVTGNASTDWFSLKVLDSTALSNKQTHTVAASTDLDAIRNVNDDWYCSTRTSTRRTTWATSPRGAPRTARCTSSTSSTPTPSTPRTRSA